MFYWVLSAFPNNARAGVRRCTQLSHYPSAGLNRTDRQAPPPSPLPPPPTNQHSSSGGYHTQAAARKIPIKSPSKILRRFTPSISNSFVVSRDSTNFVEIFLAVFSVTKPPKIRLTNARRKEHCLWV